ncbi:MAG TPA: NAD(P)H-quinone oxidoreductase [Gemmatimonadaceae bacterium]|jgi:putative PIG3 family NAD(P)H quinone oxidoreductase
MKAAVITKFGGPEVLEILDRPTPIAKPHEILVRVRASALNRADLHQREGNYPAPPGAPADIPGLEFAGEVAGVGTEVKDWREGDRVFGIVAGGGNAEFLVTDAQSVARVPNNLDSAHAAAIPEAFITAHDAMIVQAQLQADENVLIHAVGSGVGLAAVQLARAWKATPFGTARSAEKIERAKAFGLENGAVVADNPESILPDIEQWTSGEGINVTIDLLGGAYTGASLRALAPRGRIMCLATVAGRSITLPLGALLGKRATVKGTVLRARPLEEKRSVTAAFARDVVPLLASGQVRPTVDCVFELSQIREAHERLASNQTFGKVVLRV